MKRIVAVLLMAFAGFASAQKAPDNFVQWRAGLASSAQPSAEWLASVRRQGYDVVVNLAPPQVQGSLREEGGIVGATGVAYVNIPVDFQRPTAGDFRFFSEVLEANKGRNVLVHCQVNMRGSAFTFLHRVIHEGADVDEARRQLLSVWVPEGVWRRFIVDTLAAHGKTVEVF